MIFNQELAELTQGVCSYSPSNNTASQVMRSLQVTMLINNHNYGLFFLGTFLFEMKLSGQVPAAHAPRRRHLLPHVRAPHAGAMFPTGEA